MSVPDSEAAYCIKRQPSDCSVERVQEAVAANAAAAAWGTAEKVVQGNHVLQTDLAT